MVKKINRRKKDLYWHKIAELCLEHEFKPAMITEGLLDIVIYPSNKGRMTSLEMIDYCRSVVTKEDEFIYTASIGSVKRSLKCFEYTLTAEAENELDKVDIWLTKIKR